MSHIFFADDILLFGEATTSQADVMEAVLAGFCALSGQKLSLTKSSFTVSHSVNEDLRNNISHGLGIAYTNDMGHYLGMPLFGGGRNSKAYSFIIDKMQAKLMAWKSQSLSRGGRLILLKSVLAALPTYFMQATLLPANILEKIDKICKAFFWGDRDGHRSMRLVAWNNICRPKSNGGLGIRRLHPMNIALLAKLGWEIQINGEKLWVKTLTNKYGSSQNPPHANASPIWKAICKASNLVISGTTADGKWQHTPNGVYSVSSGYFAQHHTWILDPEKAFWDSIWRLKGPIRGNVLLWQIAIGALPSLEFLARHTELQIVIALSAMSTMRLLFTLFVIAAGLMAFGDIY